MTIEVTKIVGLNDTLELSIEAYDKSIIWLTNINDLEKLSMALDRIIEGWSESEVIEL